MLICDSALGVVTSQIGMKPGELLGDGSFALLT